MLEWQRKRKRVGRRFLVLMLLAVVGLASGLVYASVAPTGQVTKDDSAPHADLGGEEQFAAPRLGDRGTFLISQEADDAASQRLDFEWSGPEDVWDERGRLVTANVVRYAYSSTDGPADQSVLRHALFFSSIDDSLVGYEVENSWTTATSSSTSRSLLYPAPGSGISDAIPCPLRLSLRGATWDLQGGTVAFESCSWPQISGANGPLLLKATERGRFGPWNVVRFDAKTSDDLGQGVAWLAPDLAYPTWLEVPQAVDPSAKTVIRLASFHPGDRGLASTKSPKLEAPPITFSSPTPTLVNETGVHQVFPLADADLAARRQAEGSLDEFFQNHPDALIAAASFDYSRRYFADNQTFAPVEYRTWSMAYQAGSRQQLACVTRTDRHPTGEPEVDDALPKTQPLIEVKVSTDCAPSAESSPAAMSAVPERIPAVQSLLSRWRLQADEPLLSDDELSFAFRFDCVDASCPRDELVIEVGWRGTGRYGSSIEGSGLAHSEARLAFAADGHARWYRESRYEETDGGLLGAIMSLRAEEPSAPSPVHASAEQSSHAVPASNAVQAAVLGGGTALATAVLLWMLGRLHKVTGFIGFARVGPDRVLDHPVRSQLSRYVEDRPGISLHDLLGMLPVRRSATRHHLAVLQHARRIRLLKVNGTWRVFAAHADVATHVMKVRLECDPSLHTLASIVSSAQRPRAGEVLPVLQQRAGLSFSGARKALARAIEAGLVARAPGEQPARLYIEPRWSSLLASAGAAQASLTASTAASREEQ